MIRRIAMIAVKEWRFFERGTLVYAVLFLPLILSFLWGVCASLALEDANVAVQDESHSQEGRELVRALERAGPFHVTARPDSAAGLERALVAGVADLGVAIPVGYAKNLSRGRAAPVLVVANGADASIANEGLDYAARTIAHAGPARPRVAPARPPRVAASVRTWYARSIRGRDFLLLNAVAYNMLVIIYNPSSSLMNDRQRGALGLLRGSPIRAWELWAGIALTHGAIAIWGALTQIGIAILAYDLPFRGGAPLLFGALALLALAHVNLGCAIPALVKRLEHRTVLVTMFQLLAISLSGYLLPLEFMPQGARVVAEAIPLRHGLMLLRGIFLKGADAAALGHAFCMLALFAAGSSIVAILCIRAVLREEGEH